MTYEPLSTEQHNKLLDFPRTQAVFLAERDDTDSTDLLDRYSQLFLAAARAGFEEPFAARLREKHAPRIAHRKQTGPHCGLETSHRVLSALGLNLSADEVIALGKKLGIDTGSTIFEQLKMIEKLVENAPPMVEHIGTAAIDLCILRSSLDLHEELQLQINDKTM